MTAYGYAGDILGRHASSERNVAPERETVMHIIPWPVPMKAQAPRANDLQGLQFERQGLVLRLTEDETE